MKFITILSLAGITFFSYPVLGQGKIDLAGINYSVSPSSNLENIPSGVPGLEDFGIAVKELEIFFTIPIPLSEKVIVTLKPYYQMIDFTYENEGTFADEFRANNIYKIQLEANLTWLINDSWNITLFNRPNFSSDFRDDLSGDDLFNQPGFVVNKVINERFTVGLGVVASFVFGDQNVFPILSLKYLSENGKFFTDVTFPNVRLTYGLSEKFEVGFTLKLRGNEFNYINLPVAGSSESTDFIKFSNMRACCATQI